MTTTSPARTMKASDVIGLLRRHYLPDGKPAPGIFAPEIEAPAGGRRADLIWQGCTAAASSHLVGHEVKVTRADLAAELADLTKSHPWERYCDRWWLVIPDPALVDGFDLPDTWGVLAPPSGRRTRSMTILRPAPKLHPDEQAPALRRLATWQHWKLQDSIERERRARADEQHARRRADEAESRVPRGDRRTSPLEETVAAIVTALGGPGTDGFVGRWGTQLPVDAIVEALTDVAGVYDRARLLHHDLERRVEEFRRIARRVDFDSLDQLADSLRRSDAARQERTP